MCLWDAIDQKGVESAPFIAFATADNSTMATIFGRVGYYGAYGCCLYCPQKGWHKPGGAQYYLACLEPLNSNLTSSNYADYDLRTMAIPLAAQTEERYVYLCLCPSLC